MKNIKKILILILLLILVIAAILTGRHLWQLAYIGAGYKAKILCSGVFVSGRNSENVLEEELSDPKLQFFKTNIDLAAKEVTASAPLGIVKRTASYREGLGATLDLPKEAHQISIHKPPASDRIRELTWPAGNVVNLNDIPAEVDTDKLNLAVEWAFTEADSQKLRRTRGQWSWFTKEGSLLNATHMDLQKAHRYWAGLMTKSVMNALVGILVKQDSLNLQTPDQVKAWQNKNDPRREITLNHLMQMSSGLEFEERYSDLRSDVIRMLYQEKDAAKFAINKPLIFEPGSKWDYSSGTTNIISKIIRSAFDGKQQAYLEFPHKQLFHKIGVYSAIIETDACGTFVGSSYMYATARDWALFGLFFLQDGMWNGERILPDGWVDYSTNPAKHAPNRKYGAHWWLGPHCIPLYSKSHAEKLPTDLFSARGHEDQYVTIIPSKKLVIVRLGLTKINNLWDQAEFVIKILEAVGKPPNRDRLS